MGVDGVQHEGLEADAVADRRRRRQRRRHQEAEVQNRDRRSLLLVKTPTFNTEIFFRCYRITAQLKLNQSFNSETHLTLTNRI